MKQKVVIRVPMEDAKRRSKALKVVVGVPGVLSAAIEGADRNQIVVIGEGVDSITLTTLLRKYMGFAELIAVAVVQEKEGKKEEKKQVAAAGSTAQPVVVWPSNGGGYYTSTPQNYSAYERDQEPSCCIM